MLEGIIGAVITALASIICQVIIAASSRKSMQQVQFDSQKLIEYKIDKLTERVDKHNQLVERTYHLEEKSEILDEKLKAANRRIDDLERRNSND